MKTMHYCQGYGGNLNYHTVCGKEIRSHDDNDGATIHPEKVDCADCRKTAQHSRDLEALTLAYEGLKRRIFIESDILHASELRNAQREVHLHVISKGNLPCVQRTFSEVLDYAWHDLEKTWLAVKKADEIYADSSLMPLTGGSYSGAPVIFNAMCERAIKENVTGKSIYILNDVKNIYWGMIDVPLMKKAFKKNSLFMYNEDRDLVKIDTNKIKK